MQMELSSQAPGSQRSHKVLEGKDRWVSAGVGGGGGRGQQVPPQTGTSDPRSPSREALPSGSQSSLPLLIWGLC